VKNDEIWQILTMIKVIWPKFNFLNSRWQTDAIVKTSFCTITLLDFLEIWYEDAKPESNAGQM